MSSGIYAQVPSSPIPMFTRPVEACIIPAAQYHHVNHNILWAILKVESNFKPNTVTKNENGTQDHGMGGMNTIHMASLAKHGITPSNIQDPCISTYVTAWHLSKVIAKHGNTWYGVAAYHSATPYFNNRYQVMLQNALIKAGVLTGKIKPVPPLKPGQLENSIPKAQNKMQAANAYNSSMNVLSE
ncbi:lytic transglycosylase domain-containing protein [Comamonas sp. w2-DMI]|uniref:lytic transglycosylase domain-containing protein n=1 Tax=Comamonas sp. w2-DMI TaxID=3126391 RepID=UPI0032E46FB4